MRLSGPEAGIQLILRDDGTTRLIRTSHDSKGPDLCKQISGTPTSAKLVCLYNDRDILEHQRPTCALPYRGYHGEGDQLTLLFDQCDGQNFIRQPHGILPQWLDQALLAARAVDEVHQAGLIHLALTPDCFLFTTSRAYLTDFSHATREGWYRGDLTPPMLPINRLVYAAPEMTGRLNRSVDYRSDYYTLGVILYETLTGQPPFFSNSPHELIYQHLASSPPSMSSKSIPRPLAQIIYRLLEKDPERRYQMMDDLIEHLELVQKIILGLVNDDHRLSLPSSATKPRTKVQRLYGRDADSKTLLNALDEACRGQPRLLALSGSSGVGKTALIRESYRKITEKKAFLLSGKFDQLQRDLPYRAWLDALAQLVDYILSEPTERLEQWRTLIQQQLGPDLPSLTQELPILTNLFPNLPEPTSLPPQEARLRFHRSVAALLIATNHYGHPLVLFLDDIQWVDNASLSLLEHLLYQLDSNALLIIAAYRHQEVTATHPLQMTLDKVAQTHPERIIHQRLGPVGRNETAQLLSEVLEVPIDQVTSQAEIITSKTDGNPFFIWQLLKNLQENGGLYRDEDSKQWQWDLEAVKKTPFTENVIELMVHRFSQLPLNTKKLLALSAALGAHFHLDDLCRIADQPLSTIYPELAIAVEQEFILPIADQELENDQLVIKHLRFYHDRMQEAAYHSIPETQRPALHYHIAHWLLDQLPEPEKQQRLVEIVGHLNQGKTLITTPEERSQWRELSLRAARKAKASAAFKTAVNHLRQCMNEPLDILWKSEPGIAFDLYRERAELEFLDSQFAAGEAHLKAALERESDLYRRSDLYFMWVMQHTLLANYTLAIDTARTGLEELNEHLPDNQWLKARDKLITRIWEQMRGKNFNDLRQLPAMTSPHSIAIMKLLLALGPPCYRSHPQLWSVVVARQFNLILEDGIAPGVSYALPALGGLLTHVGQGDKNYSEEIYHLTKDLLEKDHVDSSIGFLMMGSSLTHWFAPMRLASENYLNAYQRGQASGNLQYAVYGFGHNTYCRFFQGAPLDELLSETRGYLNYSRERGNLWGIDLINGARRLFDELHGDNSSSVYQQKETEQEYLERCERQNNHQVLCIYHIMRMAARLVVLDTQSASTSLAEAEARLDNVSVQGLLPVTQYYGYRALILTLAPDRLNLSLEHQQNELHAIRDRYRAWQNQTPENFAHWYHLTEALCARLTLDTDAFIYHLDLALDKARAQRNWLNEALISLAGEDYWQKRHQPDFAQTYRTRRYNALQQGAAFKALENMETHSNAASLEVGTIIGLAQSLSLHPTLDTLVPEIIRRVAHHTGAQRLALLLTHQQHHSELRLLMEQFLERSTYHSTPKPLEQCEQLPDSILRYVARTQKALRFNRRQISDSHLLANDEYFRNRPLAQCYWCIPLSYLGDLLGVLYLEHQDNPEAFNQQQAPLTEFLAAQAAISVRNIELIEALRTEARARREAELKIENTDAELAMRRELETNLVKLASTDSLTELSNRRVFMERLRQEWAHQQRDTSLRRHVLMIDIDFFKDINDRYGHSTGDQVLVLLGELFRTELRPFDIPARLGGEEFSVLIADGSLEDARSTAERLRERVAKLRLNIGDDAISITISVGITAMEAADRSFEDSLMRADRALYQAKEAGRNRVVCQ